MTKQTQSTVRRKHVPVRTCVVCREKGEKRQLTRIVRASDGVQVDLPGKHPGRGAYLCDNAQCWQQALQSKVLDKALKMTLMDEDRKRLMQAMP